MKISIRSSLLKRSLITPLIFVVLFFCKLAHAQTLVYNFTTAGATGNTGPDQSMVDSAYNGTNLENVVAVTAGIQEWNVPKTGVYLIEATGGQGFGDFGGRGAYTSTNMYLTAGTDLKILVGQQGGEFVNFPDAQFNNQFGGGGGSFVTLTDNTPLVVAGGGGGSHFVAYRAAVDGQITTQGAAGTGTISGLGGASGNGGAQASSADGGGGLLTDGAGTSGGSAFVNGGLGGISRGQGGFGGGGGTSNYNNYRGGGGGGYSGGGGGNANTSTTCCAAGGGGGSFVSEDGWATSYIAGSQTGDGRVTISFTDEPSVQSFYFTNADATGYDGPDQSMVDNAYNGTNLEDAVIVTAGIQQWIVPADGLYGIEAHGGQGYGDFGGRGAVAYTELNLTAGTTLKLIVGQQGGEYREFPNTQYNNQFGGGGGSFVTLTNNAPLVVAGGGGGNHFDEYLKLADGQITTQGAAGTGTISGTGGASGNGGGEATRADGGGGLLTEGEGISGGAAFVHGGLGGIVDGQGGFGGGGGTSNFNNYRGGGGGGYSGGGGGNANTSTTCCAAGGGGGSFVVAEGSNSIIFAGTDTGHGRITIHPGGNKPQDPNANCDFYVMPSGAVICL